MPFGRILAIAILLTVGLGQWNSLIGILGITSNVIFEILVVNFPQVEAHKYIGVLLIALVIIGTFYFMLLKETIACLKNLGHLCFTHGIFFFFTLFFVLPQPKEVILGLVPKFPKIEGAGVLVAAFVGTTMASATFLSRPLFIQGKGIGPHTTIEDNAMMLSLPRR